MPLVYAGLAVLAMATMFVLGMLYEKNNKKKADAQLASLNALIEKQVKAITGKS